MDPLTLIFRSTWHNSTVPTTDTLNKVATDLTVLKELLDDLDTVPGDGRSPLLERDRTALTDTIGNYLLPRLGQDVGPIRIVFAGPTGSGKSTLLNSIVGSDVSRSGSVRPTTTKPLAYVRKAETARFRNDAIGYEVVGADAPILERIALIDTPDIDSTNTANHHSAAQVVATADIVVFVASSLRYADLVPWQLLKRAQERGIPVIHVLNKVSTSSAGAVNDMRRLLRLESMTGPMVRVEEHHLEGRNLVPPAGIRNLRREILDAVERHDEESGHVLAASLKDVGLRTREFLGDLTRSIEITERLRTTLKERLLDSSSTIAPATIGWSQLLKTAKMGAYPTGRKLRRHGLSARSTEEVGKSIRAGVIGMLEQRLRLFDMTHDRLVVDLTGSAVTSPAIYDAIDQGVSDWYASLVSSTGDDDVDSYRRASAAAAACEAELNGGTSVALAALTSRIADQIAERLLPDSGDQLTLRAIASASDIVDRLLGVHALADA